MSYTTHNINPKPYAYGCNIQIYWATSANELEYFYKEKTYCPNRRQKSATTAAGITLPSTTSKPHYYNLTVTKRTPYTSFAGQQQPKPNCLIHLNCLLPAQKKIYKNSMRCYLIS